jgi:hypothetical protein
MKFLGWLFALAGVVFMLLAVYGRFHGASSITLMGHRFAAATFLLVGICLTSLGIFSSVTAKH